MVNSKQELIIEEIAFTSDDFLLKGFLHLPPAAQPPVVIGCHGLFSDKQSPKQIELAHRRIQNNIAYFRFDHRGCGESNAPFEVLTSLNARCADLKAASTLLKTRIDLSGDQMGLFGSSMGGTVCLASAADLGVNAVVTWAAPIRSADLVQENAARSEDSNIPFKKNPFDISARLAGLRNILIFHGDADETVPLSHADEINRSVGNPKKLVILPQSDHRMSRPAAQKKFIQVACDWFKDYLRPE